MQREFDFKPASWLPSRDVEMLERVRNVRREDMEYTNENGFTVKVVLDPVLHFVIDVFKRICDSDANNTPLTMIFPNQWPTTYSAIAEMINTYNINCRNVHAFAMDEWADEDGTVAPLTYGAGLGYSFVNHFYKNIREDLRPDISHWHTFNNNNVSDYSKIIEEVGRGGADVVYSNTGWPGHTAFIDPCVPEFLAPSMAEFLTMGSRLVTQHPMTVCENSLFAPMGAAGDVWAVPPRAATIGPRDIANARYRFEMHFITFLGGDSWQRMISRIELYGPISMECPASIMRLFKGTCYVSEAIAKPFGSWKYGVANKDL
jgi:6-phosphogluconolactonase/glucosamine-6-phosphate isomerase/deaminase